MTRWVIAVVLVGASVSMSSLSQQTRISRMGLRGAFAQLAPLRQGLIPVLVQRIP